MVALSIEKANRFNRFYNKLTSTQEKTLKQRADSLLKQPRTIQNIEQLVQLEGYTSFQEYKEDESKYGTERELLTLESPTYFNLSAQEQRATIALITTHYQKFKLYPVVPAFNSKATKNATATTVNSAASDSPDAPWTNPPIEEDAECRECHAAYTACNQSADSEFYYERDRCYRQGPVNFYDCYRYYLTIYREKKHGCSESYYKCCSKKGNH